MKYDVNVVTQYAANNYGAVLQTYALKQHLSDLGYNAGVYRATIHENNNKLSVKSKIMYAVNKGLQEIHKKDLKRKDEKFDEFREEYLNLNSVKNARAYIAGSDQIWHPAAFHDDFYLKFADAGSIKASYAASIGVSKINETLYASYRKYLKDFKYISLREKDGQREIQRIMPDKEVRCDLDPTFLLPKEKWEQLSYFGKCEENEPFIVLYILHIPSNINKLVSWLKDEFKCNIVLLDNRGYLNYIIKHDRVVRDAGPLDFLAYLREAKAVVTTSFHGTALSIIFNKELYSINNPNFSSRISNIMDVFGLQSVDENTDHFSRMRIDYAPVNEIIREKREYSNQYLTDILK